MAQDEELKFRLPKEWKQRLIEMGKSDGGLKASNMGRQAIKNFLSPNRKKLARNHAPMETSPLDAQLKFRISKAEKDGLRVRGNGEHGDLSDMARMAVWEFIPPKSGQERQPEPAPPPKDPFDDRTLRFPQEIADRIGLSANKINSFKAKGCKFLGRKTSIEWVRAFIDQTAET
ncbi:MAG: hypothetical protein ABIP85_06740 [Chthoniobacteraceae bacterium]